MKKDKSIGLKSLSMKKGGVLLPVVNPCAAGIDIGSTEHYVAFLNGDGCQEVHSFAACTEDLRALVSLLKAHGVTTAAMEATGVYFVPLYLMLEEEGIEPWLVNARHVKNVTGRKSDESDAAWLHKLHACGLLQRSFQPEAADRRLREYVRHRKGLIRQNSDAIRRMQKALDLMNVKLHTVISDLAGKSGFAIVDAILSGERDATTLASLCDGRIKADREDVRRSLVGVWKDEFVFMLGQARQEFVFRKGQIDACEELIYKDLMDRVARVRDGDITFEQEVDVKKKAPEERVRKAHQSAAGIDDRRRPLRDTANIGCHGPGVHSRDGE